MIDTNDLIGHPYELGARGPDKYDCWGLIVEVFRRAGVTLPEFDDARAFTSRQMLELMNRESEDLARRTERPAYLNLAYDCRYGHIGVMMSEHRVLHASRTFGVVLAPLQQFIMVYPYTQFYEVLR